MLRHACIAHRCSNVQQMCPKSLFTADYINKTESHLTIIACNHTHLNWMDKLQYFCQDKMHQFIINHLKLSLILNLYSRINYKRFQLDNIQLITSKQWTWDSMLVITNIPNWWLLTSIIGYLWTWSKSHEQCYWHTL